MANVVPVPGLVPPTTPGPVPPPTPNILTQLGTQYGDRTLHLRDCRDNWICPSCKTEHEPVKGMLINLPVYECRACRTRNPTDYAWSITDITYNDVELDFMVYDQGASGHCVIYAVAGAMDCAVRIRGAMSTLIVCAAFDPPGFLQVYKTVMGHDYDHMPRIIKLYPSADQTPIVLGLVKDHGFPLKRGVLEQGASLSHKIANFFRVDTTDVFHITRLLANGFPLVGAVRVGSLFQFLSAGQPYAAAIPGNESGSHSVILIGSGTAPRGDRIEVFFVCRNSHGITAHANYHKEKYGGDFLVWASDIWTLWGFYLP